MDILLDTNLVLIYSRATKLSERIEEQYGLFKKENRLLISVVTLGEIDALSKKLNVGRRRMEMLENVLQSMAKIRLNIRAIIDRYGDIDAYSRGN